MDAIKLESRENAINLESRVEELEKALSTLACLSSLSCLASLGGPIQPQWDQVTDHSRREPVPIDRSSMNHWPATVWAPSRPLDLKLTQKPKYITDPWPASSQESETDLKPVDPYTLKHISQERMSRQHLPREIQTRHPVLLEIDLMEEQAKAVMMMASKKG